MNTRPDHHPADNALSPMIVTFAATSLVEGMREHIGKRWKAKGKWLATDGVKSPKFFFERVPCRGLDEIAAAISARIARGGYSIIAGAPKNALNLTQGVSREGKNFIDAPSRLMISDMDGVQPGFGQDLSTPEAFTSGEIIATIRGRLRSAGVHSLADAKMVVIATSSTGFPVNAKGKPANGEGRVRVLFETNASLTLAEQKTLMDTVARLPMFSAHCPDTSINSPEHFIFIDRAILPKERTDPIREVVMVSQGRAGREIVDVRRLARELKLKGPDEAPGSTQKGVDSDHEPFGPNPNASAGDAAWLFKMRQMRAAPEKQEKLLSDLMDTLPNECPPKGEGGMNKYIGVGKGIWGACGGQPWGFGIWAKWCAQWPDDDPEANVKEWEGFKTDDQNGIDYLVRWALKIRTPEALAAVAAIEAAKPGNSDSPPASADPARGDLLIASWLTRKIPPRDYLLGHVICTTSRWFVFGETGVGKTLLIADMAGAMAKGEALLGWGARRPARIMYLDGEMPAETFKERMQLVASRFGGSIPFYGYNRDDLGDGQMPPLNTEEGEKWLMREIEAVKPDLIVFDSIMCLLDGVMGEEESWTQAKHLVRRLTSKRIAQIWLHHTGHDASKGFGTKTREWEMDTVVRLNFADENRNAIALEFTKARLRTPATADEFKPLVISLEASGWTSSGLARAGVGSRRSSEAARVKSAIVAVYNQHAVGVAGADGKIVRKINVNALRDEVRNRGWVDVKDTGGLTDPARKAFHSAKGDLLSGGGYVEPGGMFWKDEPISFPPVEPEGG